MRESETKFAMALIGSIVAGMLVLLFLIVTADDPGLDPGKPDPNSRSWVDEHGRVCTQVDPPGKAIALDCDYPPPTP